MISSNLILNMPQGIKAIPLIVAIACAVITAIAFLVGFTKGFRRISWGCVTCLVATGGFALINGLLVKEKVVLNINVQGVLDGRALTTFLVAITCVAAVLVLYGLLTWILRPSYKIVNKNPIVGEKFGIKIEDDDDEHAPNYVRWKNAGRPTLVGRLIGGVICAINSLGIMAIILSALVIIVSATALNETILASAMNVKATKILLDFAMKYAVDFVIISFIVLMSFKGYTNGLVGSVRFLVVSFGGMILGVLAFALPFMNSSALFFTPKFVERCTALLGGIPAQFRVIAGKLLAGVLLFAIFMVLLAVFNFALNKLNYVVIRLKPVRTFDGVLACFFYLLLGVLICVGVWCVLYAMEYCGLVTISKAFSENTSLAGSFMKLGEKLIKPVLEKFVV